MVYLKFIYPKQNQRLSKKLEDRVVIYFFSWEREKMKISIQSSKEITRHNLFHNWRE